MEITQKTLLIIVAIFFAVTSLSLIMYFMFAARDPAVASTQGLLCDYVCTQIRGSLIRDTFLSWGDCGC